MGRFLLRALFAMVGLAIAAHIVPGVHYNSLTTLALAALLLGVANAILRPILVILTLPITVLTLGLFLLVINAGIILLVSKFLHGFIVDGWKAAILTAIVTGILSWIAHGLTDEGRGGGQSN